jgi:hypothetical protein
MRPRLLVSETLDPNGAMFGFLRPDLRALGYDVTVLPTQEAVVRLGVEAYRRLVLDVVRAERPSALVVHPPYDHLNLPLARKIRRFGCRIIAFAFDDPIVRPRWRPRGELAARLQAIDALYDLYATTSDEMRETAQLAGLARVVTLRWAASLDPLAPRRLPAVNAAQVLLVGRAYPRRMALVRMLGAAGLTVRVFGSGWPETAGSWPEGVEVGPPLTREGMIAHYRAAGVVVTTGDWENVEVPMVKVRLLEVAFAGGFQVAQASPDLRAYFPETEVPGWRTEEELVARVREALAAPGSCREAAAAAHARALREHRWIVRWPELIAAAARAGRPLEQPPDQPRRSTAYTQLLAQTASQLEASGATPAALSFWFEASRAFPRGADPPLGAGRCLFKLGRPATAARWLRAGLARLAVRPVGLVEGLHLCLPPGTDGRGLGLSGQLTPAVEAFAFLLAALLAAGDASAAEAAIAEVTDDDVLVGAASLLRVNPQPGTERAWRDLLERALAAHPTARRDLLEERRAAWEAALAELAGADRHPPG